MRRIPFMLIREGTGLPIAFPTGYDQHCLVVAVGSSAATLLFMSSAKGLGPISDRLGNLFYREDRGRG